MRTSVRRPVVGLNTPLHPAMPPAASGFGCKGVHIARRFPCARSTRPRRPKAELQRYPGCS